MRIKRWLASFSTLRWRLTLYYTGLVCVLVIGLGLFVYNRVESFAQDSVRQQLVNYPAPPLPTPQPPPADPSGVLQQYSNQIARQALRDPTVLTWVLDGNGRPISPNNANANFSSDETLSDLVDVRNFLPSRELLQRTRQNGSLYTVQVNLKNNTTGKTEPVTALAYVSVAPGSEGRPPGQLVFVLRVKPLTEIREILDQMRGLLIGGLLVVLLLAILLGLPLARLGLRPINKVTTIARQTRGGDLSRRVELSKQAGTVAASDEVWQMAHEFNAMLDQLEAAFKAQQASEIRTRQFVADASHELRSPLTILGGYLDVLSMGAKNDPERAAHIINAMRLEIKRLSRMVVDLLTLTRLDQDRHNSLKVEPLILADLLNRVHDNFRVLVNGRQLELFIAPEATKAIVLADSDRLYQVVTNLLENAIRYTDAHGQIRVGLTKVTSLKPNSNGIRAGWLSIAVADNGCGIEAEHLPLIFDRFYRADRSRSRNTGNSGLGLAISKSIVEAHGGTLTVESTVNKGSTFIVCLPATAPSN